MARRLVRLLRWLLTRSLLCYCGVVVVLMFLENKLIYPAPKYPVGDWEPETISPEDVFFSSEDGVRLHGWYLDHPQPRCFLLYCHGNGENVAYVTPVVEELREHLDAAIFVFDYRGYGRSEGSPHEAGLLQDTRAAHRWLAKKAGVDESDIVVMGRSIGGAVAVDAAVANGARALVLESTFHNMPDIAAQIYWWAPVRLLMRSRFDSEARIGRYHGALLQSHGTADSLVPLDFAERLFRASPSTNKKFITLPGLDHNDPQPVEYYSKLAEFLNLADPR